jgi:ELWxxDGT repeat protein
MGEESRNSLWRSDGTSDGTVRVADVSARQWPISQLTAAGGAVYFVVDQATFDEARGDEVDHRQLWTSDGTAGGTRLVAALNPATLHLLPPHNLFHFNGSLYFTADSGMHGDQLYRTDGTAEGTVALTNVPGGIFPHDPIVLDGTLYFSVNDGVHGDLLWKSDGTPEGTTPIIGALGGRSPTLFKGAIYYSARTNPTNQAYQVWKTDGTAEGTVQITDLNTGSFFGLSPSNFTVFKDALYFSGNDGVHGNQLWKSDGTTAGTEMLTNISGSGFSYYGPLTIFKDTLYFQFAVASGVQLWKTDGTAAGTTLVARLNVSNRPREMIDVNGTLFILISDDAHGGIDRLWTSDGTTSGTVALVSMPIIRDLIDYNGTLFFEANDGVHGYQLWKSDGTAAGTDMVTNVNPTQWLGLSPGPLTIADGRLLFAGTDGVNGQELWVSDGTADGTVMVADLNPGPASSSPANLTVVNGVVYFTADDGTHGVEVWKVGAVTTGLQLLMDPTVTAGVPFTVTVQALNDFGGIDPNYRGTVQFTSSDGRAALPDDFTFTAGDAGRHTFAGVTLFAAGPQTLTVGDLSADTLTATGSILVHPGPVDSFAVVVAGPVIAGQPFDLTVTALDAYGNVVTDYQGQVSFLSLFNTDDLPDSYTFTPADAGSHVFSVTVAAKGHLLVVVDPLASAFGFTFVAVDGSGGRGTRENHHEGSGRALSGTSLLGSDALRRSAGTPAAGDSPEGWSKDATGS